MKVKAVHFFIAIALIIVSCLTQIKNSAAKDKELTPEEVIAAHLKALGPPEFLANIKNRGTSGKSTVEFIQGGVGTQSGQAIVVSAGHNLSIILKYGSTDYPGEYFAFNGTDVEVATISPGQRSPLGDFIFRYKGLMKEGLVGGVWSLGWPLLETGKRNASLKYVSAKVEGRELHEIEYAPQGGLNNIKVKLFFEPGTFRHVRTEYSLRVAGEQALQAGQTVTRGAPASSRGGMGSGAVTRDAGVQDHIADSHYRLIEKFDAFKEVKFKDSAGSTTGNLTLPHSYTLEYSVEGQGSSFLGRWNLAADQWMQNGTINSSIFKAHN